MANCFSAFPVSDMWKLLALTPAAILAYFDRSATATYQASFTRSFGARATPTNLPKSAAQFSEAAPKIWN
jgi:hypothetical protein